MPMVRNKHSSGSEWPVTIAMRGRCPSLWLRGKRVRAWLVSAVVAHAGTLGIMTARRHLPVSTTSGTLLPGGTPSSVNRREESLRADANAGGGAKVWHADAGQEIPSVIVGGAADGT